MVYTLTFCPGLEYSASLDEITIGADNAVSNGELHVSGSGAVIAKVLGELDVPSTVLGFAAGFTGGEIEGILRGRGINTDLVYLDKGLSPLNFVLDHGENAKGPTRFAPAPFDIPYSDLMSLLSRLERLSDGDVLVLSGDVPDCVPADIYSHIPDTFAGKNVRLVLDVPAEPLAKCLQFQPYLIITDRRKLGEIFGEDPQSEDQLILCVKNLQELGAQNVLISPAESGTIILLDSDHNILRHKTSDILFSETAQCAMTAGFIAGSEDKDVNTEYALMLAAAAGRAAAEKRGIPSRSNIIDIMKVIMKLYA